MTPFEMGLWAFPVLLALIFLRAPIGLAMLIVGFAGAWILRGTPLPVLSQLKSLTYGVFSNESLSVVPLFLLMGQFATRGGMSAALFRAASAFLGHRRGGVAMASVGACAGFGAICGSSLATAATMGQVALPELRRYGYSGALATGALAAGGTLGILIPPSIVLVIYAILTEQNIVKLFIAAIIPGVLAAVGYMITIAIYVRLRPESAGVREKAGPEERRRALIEVWPVLGTFLLVIGGIYAGWFTPTEGAAVGAALTGIIAWAGGGLSRRDLAQVLAATAVATGMVFLIILGAEVLKGFLASTRVPQLAADYVGGLGISPWIVLAIMLVSYLILGCVMDSLSMILLTIPIFWPVISGLDFGLGPEELALWFGIIVLIVVEVGLITPPVGMNLFIINGLAKDVPMAHTFQGALPFVASDIIRVVILAAFPVLSIGLVQVMF